MSAATADPPLRSRISVVHEEEISDGRLCNAKKGTVRNY
jgi:hypothetical protein